MRVLLLLILVLSVMVVPSAALAHPAGSDYWDGRYTDLSDTRVVTDARDVTITRQSDNVEFIAQVDPGGPTSDMQFQRREGRQVLGGEVIDQTLDIVVMGGTAVPGLSIIDVTDPTAPKILTTVSCGGFHSAVAVYENYAVQSWDGTPRPCEEGERANRDDVDRPGDKGVRIYDITDPADPVLVRFYGKPDGIPSGVHNLTINGEAGLAYLNMAEFNADNPPWGFVDLNAGADLDLTIKDIRDWSPTAGDGCHDSGLAPERGLYACAGITASYIWDMSDPRQPVEVAVIPNPSISIHHGARFTPDEMTLVLGDETAGAIAGTPEAACPSGRGTNRSPVGATWFYDVSIPQVPVPVGTFSVSDTQGEYCTSHFYGFVEGTTLMTGGWYDAGIEIVDYEGVTGGVPGTTSSYAFFEPEESGFFSAYAWHGYVYGSSFEYGAAGRNRDSAGRGLWIIEVDGIEDVEPSAVDEGNVWGRWSSTVDLEVGATTMTDPAGDLVAVPTHTEVPTDALAMGVVALGAVALVGRRRQDA